MNTIERRQNKKMEKTKTPEIVEATQFNPEEKEWPKQVRPWNKIVPRDMSWGFVDTALGRMHIQAGDWIVKLATGQTLLVADKNYKSLNIQS